MKVSWFDEKLCVCERFTQIFSEDKICSETKKIIMVNVFRAMKVSFRAGKVVEFRVRFLNESRTSRRLILFRRKFRFPTKERELEHDRKIDNHRLPSSSNDKKIIRTWHFNERIQKIVQFFCSHKRTYFCLFYKLSFRRQVNWFIVNCYSWFFADKLDIFE